MKISIIVPVLNSGSYIIDCIESLVNQDFQKDQYEIIIVDNGSKDNTMEILSKYKDKIKDKITIVRESKKGSYVARNAGIAIAKGEIIAFTDADCIADKNWLEELNKGFVNKDIGCVVGAINPYPGNSIVEIYSKNKEILSQESVLNSKFLPYGQTANVAYRRNVFDMIGNFDGALISGGDADLSWRMQIYTFYKLIYCPTSIIQHHHRSTFIGLFRQQFRYGFGRILLYKKYDEHMKSHVDTNYDIKYNIFHSISLMTNIILFYIRSFKRLLGICNKYDMYEPLLSTLFISGYALGKIYGSTKMKKSFFSTL